MFLIFVELFLIYFFSVGSGFVHGTHIVSHVIQSTDAKQFP
jgi:hypothetical protein